MPPRVKICCISSREEAATAIQYGAAALGLVGKMPSGPGIITDEAIYSIAQMVPPPIATFLLTSETIAQDIIEHHQKVHTTTIQLVDALPNRDYLTIRERLPHVKLVQVIHVINEDSVEEAIEISQWVDAILLDSGNPNLSVKELGGTGRTHNWQLSRQIRDVKQAIETVEPFGVDLCSGVRTEGKLDERKLEAFFKAVGH